MIPISPVNDTGNYSVIGDTFNIIMSLEIGSSWHQIMNPGFI